MYRPQIKVLDATIRDGGLINDWDFSLEMVRDVYRSLAAAGVDIMEIGYRASKKLFDPSKVGPWRFCDEEMLKRVTDGIKSESMMLSAMVDIDRVEEDDILPCEESELDMIRVATYIKDIDKAIALANLSLAKGYRCTINIMAISHALQADLSEALRQIEEETKVEAVYIVDSFGALYSEQIDYLAGLYRSCLPTKEIGIHAHNNMQLGYANTIAAIIKNVNYLDATLYGIGRGAGNCPLELLIAFLKNPKFNLRPVLDIISRIMLPLRETIEWGYLIPYMLVGSIDQHPRDAIAWLKSEERNDFVAFYDKLMVDNDDLT